MFIIVFFFFGILSIPAIIFSVAFIPALSFWWTWLNNGEYINYHDHWLQSDLHYVDQAIFFSLISFLSSLSCIFLLNINFYKRILYFKSMPRCPSYFYLILIFLFMYFFWLSEPSFHNILSSTYTEIRQGRYDQTQFAGSLAVIFWLIAFSIYLSRKNCEAITKKNILNKIFIYLTILAMFWLFLHARRNELIGIGVVSLLAMSERKSKNRVTMITIFFLALLVMVERVRTDGLFIYAGGFDLGSATSKSGIFSLPGGMSNIFMSYLQSLHFFDGSDYFLGETYINYVLQLLPTFLSSFFGLSPPNYFYQDVIENYSNNGGLYVGAEIYGNFGSIGVLLFGIFVSFYIFIITFLIRSKNLVSRVLALFLVALVFRGFWYGMVALTKPIFIVFFPAYLLFFLVKVRRAERH
ncbi:oligosaccharide repeat unit polymerase [Litorivicinus sp.]|nr:oligosaccharide repeat unit polymerase [Litorivicinus sp.]